MALTLNPTPWASAYGCGFCAVSAQDLHPVTDEQGNQLYNDEGDRALIYNDEAVSSAELNFHTDEWHPIKTRRGKPVTDDDGNPVREHVGVTPPDVQ